MAGKEKDLVQRPEQYSCPNYSGLQALQIVAGRTAPKPALYQKITLLMLAPHCTSSASGSGSFAVEYGMAMHPDSISRAPNIKARSKQLRVILLLPQNASEIPDSECHAWRQNGALSRAQVAGCCRRSQSMRPLPRSSSPDRNAAGIFPASKKTPRQVPCR